MNSMTGNGIRAGRFFCLMRDAAVVTLPDFRSNTAFGAERCKNLPGGQSRVVDQRKERISRECAAEFARQIKNEPAICAVYCHALPKLR
ncbi:hypothetical protein Fuma_05958 [Fuerstiella marisgermanici]|uniref:Uncharacterized protein n=1 Tax=Fuerstiella marisgermanici TaxID=1891926 RepID=A0A1P8WQG1_9PLAN|nr:hypothetical protein Fuma_05958 [Fuerstiella marisgermanici]